MKFRQIVVTVKNSNRGGEHADQNYQFDNDEERALKFALMKQADGFHVTVKKRNVEWSDWEYLL